MEYYVFTYRIRGRSYMVSQYSYFSCYASSIWDASNQLYNCADVSHITDLLVYDVHCSHSSADFLP